MATQSRRYAAWPALAAVLLAGGCARQPAHPDDQRLPDQPPRPTVTAPPAVRPEPPLPPGRAPVVVHDCDHGGGYEVNQWVRPQPVAAGNPEAHLVSVYQTSSEHSYGYHPAGAADVYIHRTARPVVLIFSAYEPTLWRIHADPGVRVSRVVLYGYHRQQVTGVPQDTEVVDQIGRSRPRGGGEPPQTLAEDAGATILSSTYCYDAATFSLRA